MPKIKVIEYNDADGDLKEIYDDLIKSRGKLAEVHKIQSLNPATIVSHMDLYMKVMFGQSPLKRLHREMMAVVVSKANQCDYCLQHHLEAVKSYWKDDLRANLFKNDHKRAYLNERELLLCEYAKNLTLFPSFSDSVDILKNHGFDDREILDATLVIAYFNFVNRIILALDVSLEENPGGYKY